jgi:glutamate:GABA antiporter
MAIPKGAAPVESTTVLAAKEKTKLIKSLRRFDMVFFTVCAFVGLDTLGVVASHGAQGFTWLVVLGVTFVAPYALVMAEVGSAFTQEGGPYEWTKLAFGRLHAAIASVLYWITNPLWVGGSLAFLATDSWRANVFAIGHGTAGDYLFKGIFIWLSIGVSIVSLRYGKWIPNLGALLRIVLMGFFTLTVVIYAFDHGVHGFAARDLSPTGPVFLALVPLLLFNYVGFELQNGAAEEMDDPQRDVPISVARGAILGVLLYAIPVFGIILVLPADAVTGIGGFIDAVATTFTGVYGGAAHTLLVIMTLCFVGTLVTSGAVWMIGSDRIQAVSAYDGSFPGFFGVFNGRFGTPVRVNMLSGLVSTAFMAIAIGAFDRGSDATFQVVLAVAVSTTLISYLWIFPAAVKLRFNHGLVPRPYRVPFGDWGIRVAGGVITLWVALGSWVAVFPGTLEELFGVGYSFHEAWGVSRAKFEALTVGTLVVIVAIALIGFALGRPVRERRLDLPLSGPSAAGKAPG